MGAFGAHRMASTPETFKEVWKTAQLYHFMHTLALGIVATGPFTMRKKNIVGGLFGAGILLFSGGCYTVALMQSRKWGVTAPFGGFAFIGGWLALGFL